jgi:hypothetical protein
MSRIVATIVRPDGRIVDVDVDGNEVFGEPVPTVPIRFVDSINSWEIDADGNVYDGLTGESVGVYNITQYKWIVRYDDDETSPSGIHIPEFVG